MDQLWLGFSLTGLVTGFGLLIALLFLRRIASVPLPPVVSVIVAFLLMGLASFSGVYLRILEVPRDVLGYRLLNSAAWGFAAFAPMHYLIRQKRLTPAASALIVGVLVAIATFLGAHPPSGALLDGAPAVRTAVMITVEAIVGVLAVLVGFDALRQSHRTASRPWRAFLRGFGAALLLLMPANLVDFTVSLTITGGRWPDGLAFAAGYGAANIVMIAAILRGMRLAGVAGTGTAGTEAPAVPEVFVVAFGITRREREIIEKLLLGKKDREIAAELFISPRTVDTHLRTIFRKCDVNSRHHLSRLVSSHGELRSSD
ncbi:MAG: LuxR C-terminal-related transcriptional regulator [Spirochaetota bacterium]